MDLEEYQALLAELENKEHSAQRLEGARDQLLSRLREEFGVKSLAEGRKLLRRWEGELSGEEADLARKVEAYQTKWGGKET